MTKILVVDDEATDRELVKRCLAPVANLEPSFAHTGEDAWEYVQKDPPDIVLTDLRMPGIDGIEVLRRVRKKHPDMAVVILTGHGTDKDEKEAIRLGASAYLKKPVDVDQLVGTLHKVWNRLKKSKDAVDTLLMAAALSQAGETDIAQETMAELMDEENGKSKGKNVRTV